ncbi:MAG TPA: glycosyltransferase, partial [Acidimicrobiales bacterium]|nr:glycosyltransferase [Acidimicrobiales bacterium]
MTPPTSPKVARERRRNRELAIPNADGSPLEGFVEHPADGATIERQSVMSGWHTWDKEPILTVLVEHDGRIVGRARASDAVRDDVAAALGDPRYANAGWVVDLDFRALTADAVTLVPTVFAAGRREGVRLAPLTVTLEGAPTVDERGEPIPPPDEVIGRLDEPRPGRAVARGPLTVTGWARATSGSPIVRVELAADGTDLGRARLGLDRADVAEFDDAPDAPICGFEQLVDLGVLDAATTTVTLRATAVARDGLSVELESTVDVVATPVDPVVAEVAPLEPAAAAPGELRLLVVTHDLGYGGGQLWLYELLRRARAGSAFECTVVSFRSGALAAALEAQGVEVHVTSPLPVDDDVAYEGRLAELAAWLSHRRFTASLVNTFRSFPGADLAARLGVPVVWAVHESWTESLIWSFDHPGVRVAPSVRAKAARALASAGAVVFESAATRALYESRAPGRTVVVPYGVDTAA